MSVPIIIKRQGGALRQVMSDQIRVVEIHQPLSFGYSEPFLECLGIVVGDVELDSAAIYAIADFMNISRPRQSDERWIIGQKRWHGDRWYEPESVTPVVCSIVSQIEHMNARLDTMRRTPHRLSGFISCHAPEAFTTIHHMS